MKSKQEINKLKSHIRSSTLILENMPELDNNYNCPGFSYFSDLDLLTPVGAKMSFNFTDMSS